MSVCANHSEYLYVLLHAQVIQDPHALHIDDADATHVMSPVAAAMATGEGSVSTTSQSTGHVATSKSSGVRGSVAATGNSRGATAGIRRSSSAGKDSGMASSANSLTSQDEDTEENSQKQGQGQSDHTHSLDIDSETTAQVLSDVSSITSMHPVNEIGHSSSSSRTQRQSQTAGCASSGTRQEHAHVSASSGCVGFESSLDGSISAPSESCWAQLLSISPFHSPTSMSVNHIPVGDDGWPLPEDYYEQLGFLIEQEAELKAKGRQVMS